MSSLGLRSFGVEPNCVLMWHQFNAPGSSLTALASGRHQGQDNRCSPPYPIREYMTAYGTPGTGCLDGCRLELTELEPCVPIQGHGMRLDGNELRVREHMGKNRVTAVGAFV